jgi:tripartite-type tricarboxylate transporter receptor subunit TctC
LLKLGIILLVFKKGDFLKVKKLLQVISTLLLVIVFAAGCSSASSSEGAEGGSDYPKKTIKMIVPWDAGGDTDVIMRLIADKLSEELGQNVVVTNIPGGGGSIGAKEGMGAKGDGYTIIAGHDSIAMSELTGITDFNYFDFKPVSLVTSTHDIIATSIKSKWDSMEDVVKDSKENPGNIKFGATLGSTSHLTPASIQYISDIEFNIVGYEGTANWTAC